MKPAPRQHTPGPWQITAGGCAIVGNKGGTLVVETGLAYWKNLAAASAQSGTLANHHIPEAEANALLIASAPDLLAALAGCADALREAGKDFAQANKLAARPNLYELHEQTARAAIARATGGNDS